MSASVQVFGRRPLTDGATGTGAGVRKPPREETAGWDAAVVRQTRHGGGREGSRPGEGKFSAGVDEKARGHPHKGRKAYKQKAKALSRSGAESPSAPPGAIEH